MQCQNEGSEILKISVSLKKNTVQTLSSQVKIISIYCKLFIRYSEVVKVVSMIMDSIFIVQEPIVQNPMSSSKRKKLYIM